MQTFSMYNVILGDVMTTRRPTPELVGRNSHLHRVYLVRYLNQLDGGAYSLDKSKTLMHAANL